MSQRDSARQGEDSSYDVSALGKGLPLVTVSLLMFLLPRLQMLEGDG